MRTCIKGTINLQPITTQRNPTWNFAVVVVNNDVENVRTENAFSLIIVQRNEKGA